MYTVELNLRIHVKMQQRHAVLVSFLFVTETQSSFSCWGFLSFLNGTPIQISEVKSRFLKTVFAQVFPVCRVLLRTFIFLPL